jgi:hypothetical protein
VIDAIICFPAAVPADRLVRSRRESRQGATRVAMPVADTCDTRWRAWRSQQDDDDVGSAVQLPNEDVPSLDGVLEAVLERSDRVATGQLTIEEAGAA